MTDRDATARLRVGAELVDSAAARAWIERRASRDGQMIDGLWRKGASDRVTTVSEPGTAQPLLELRPAADGDARAAVEAALNAANAWRALASGERAASLRAFARAVEAGAAELAVLEALGGGTPIRDALERQVPLAARHFEFCASQIEGPGPSASRREPLGVVAVLCVPGTSLAGLAATVARALAAGNTVVVAAGAGSALGALRLADAALEAGLPNGVLNVLSGDLPSAIAVATAPGVGGLTFAGARDDGAEVRGAVAGRDLVLAWNAGTRALVVVHDDADLDSAAAGAIELMARFGDPSRRGPTRLLLHEAIADVFCDHLRWRLDRLRVRDPLDRTADIGPVGGPDHLTALDTLRETAEADGAAVHVASCGLPGVGWFASPMLVYDAPPAARAAQSEAAGPVMTATTFRSMDEAVALAGAVVVGTEVSLWTEDVTVALAGALAMPATCVSVNGVVPADPELASEPDRESGFGGVGGRDGILTFGRRRSALAASAGSATSVRGAGSETTDVEPESATVMSVGDAVRRATGARGWSALPAAERAGILRRAAALCGDGPDAGIGLLLRSYAAWLAADVGTQRQAADGGLVASTRLPAGVVGVVVSRDDAGADRTTGLAAELIVAALAVGNNVVAGRHTRNQAPLSELERALREAGAPDEALAVVTGPSSATAVALADHGGVDAVWLVGDCGPADTVERHCANGGKRLGLMRAVGTDAADAAGEAPAGQAVDGELLHLLSREKSVWVGL